MLHTNLEIGIAIPKDSQISVCAMASRNVGRNLPVYGSGQIQKEIYAKNARQFTRVTDRHGR